MTVTGYALGVVTNGAGQARSVAPGRLESVRALLNTWRVPNDTRVATDLLPDLATDAQVWAAQLPSLPAPTPGQLPPLAAVRNQLRRALNDSADLGDLLATAALRLRVEPGPPLVLQHQPADPASTCDAALGIVADALSDGTWTRLKACPDCRWAFYDHTRNASRTWCGMTAGGPQGRACGSIAKTRTYRQRGRRGAATR